MAHKIQFVGVIGTGVIGASWTCLFIAKGLRVLVSDPASGAKEKLDAFLRRMWPTMDPDLKVPGASPDTYEFVDDMSNHLDQVDFVQENGPENLAFKRKLFSNLDSGAPGKVILASSSSGICSSQFVTDCNKDSSRILIGHPFNPPHLIPLVEVVPHPETSPSVVEATMKFYRNLGKSPIHIQHETPGFVANRLQAAVANEAYSLVQRGIISPEDMDACMTTGLGPRWAFTGPIMGNVLSGGGGYSGFCHLLEHLGPALHSWGTDMAAHPFVWSQDSRTTLKNHVEKWLQEKDTDEVEKERNEGLIALLKLKKKYSNLV